MAHSRKKVKVNEIFVTIENISGWVGDGYGGIVGKIKPKWRVLLARKTGRGTVIFKKYSDYYSKDKAIKKALSLSNALKLKYYEDIHVPKIWKQIYH